MAADTGARGASFEARPEEGRAPQDDGGVCGHAHLANPPRRSYKPGFIRSYRREICMIFMYSQIAPSRPKLMLDACLAR